MTTDIKSRPILLRAHEVRNIIDRRQTQTRRIIKPQPAVYAGTWEQRPAGTAMHDPRYPHGWHHESPSGKTNIITPITCPYGVPGDLLWVREEFTLKSVYDKDDGPNIIYRADGDKSNRLWAAPSRMFRRMSRLTLRITGVRVERLQDISEEDAQAEGCGSPDWPRYYPLGNGDSEPVFSAREVFQRLWNDINGKRAPWSSNPWVWVLEFERVQP